MRFSERIGARSPPRSGLEEASDSLRTALWNALHGYLFPSGGVLESVQARENAVALWRRMGWRTDQVPHHGYQARDHFSQVWFDCKWSEFFDALEVATQVVRHVSHVQWFESLNSVLLAEGCAYRFISGELAPLTNPLEAQEVASAAESAIPAVATHIRDALKLLPPHENANPRNSVKESISAVEAAVKRLSDDPSATLTAGLSAFEAKYGDLHPALRAGLVKLYGYTSDEKGVRHALVEETANVTVEDARFMLVTCSAFANYLVALASAQHNE